MGSRNVKIIQMEEKQIINKNIYNTIDFYRKYGEKGSGSLKINLQELGFKEDDIVATGYGKITVQVDGAEHIPEIQAHVKGAIYQTGLENFTLLDIGGQDTKIIQVRNSKIADFMTNDRCAASSGRYMENMAHILGITMEELSKHYKEPVEISSTCAIFGETEIIGRIVEGYSTERLAAAINYAVYRRFSSMLKKLKSDSIVLSGGGSLNDAIAKIIETELSTQTVSLSEPQFNGAIGCCVK
ncbi:Activator of 2-hydroxyglutaryl-CoA dehydratase (HSP70-class ATPase domain) [Candidatus Syntrophocurvum alkaliphilum]|uniref:Activator of 2-hydroxyglutaryl-CoA dehydratase (HSP70-class ATPase domain) n=1 Tax=Candidatus Syntrophocurvum alkaliphilum TaxID=2293317 RepID=A0A6I6D6N4_9FIRM|nr:Activator of 2-hydroxyglutaryl-CoA dehydratase (HSP70-class ATPase domain) [Candidatus Syntrophocurvum alkaliphilum]